jgi:hypothetical protein
VQPPRTHERGLSLRRGPTSKFIHSTRIHVGE